MLSEFTKTSKTRSPIFYKVNSVNIIKYNYNVSHTCLYEYRMSLMRHFLLCNACRANITVTGWLYLSSRLSRLETTSAEQALHNRAFRINLIQYPENKEFSVPKEVFTPIKRYHCMNNIVNQPKSSDFDVSEDLPSNRMILNEVNNVLKKAIKMIAGNTALLF